MQNTQRFAYKSFQELQQDIARRNLDLPTSEDFSILARPARFGRLTIPNRLSIHPMEGCDGEPDGSPGGLTVRRYQRFAAGGAGLLWVEACAVVPEGRANPRQLWIHEGNVGAFAAMLASARQAAAQAGGPPPVFVLQLTHSGRYSKPGKKPAPIIAQHNPILDPRHGLSADHPLITDEELDRLQGIFVRAAELAAEAGFDAVDVKSCHRYLCSELLSSHAREGSRYGGSFENRTRLLRETAQKIRRAVGDRIEVTCRMNIYDAIPYPYGWGVARDEAARAKAPGAVGPTGAAPAGPVGVPKPDLADPLRLVGELKAMGFGGMNLTVANPYFNPYVNRPADWMIAHMPDAPEHPLEGVARLLRLTRDVQKAYPDLCIVGTGYSWLRQYYPYFAAGAIENGWVSVAGLGRGAFAYPDFARDILRTGRMDAHKVCVACSSCTQIMRDGGRSGCVVRDAEVYGPIFRLGRDLDSSLLQELAAQCRGCTDAMCTAACPAGVDVPGFLGALAEGDERGAYRILSRNNVLPGICGAVCPVEVQCQSACIQRCLAGSPVPIARIQRNLSILAVEAGWAAVEVPAEATGKRVAVVGAGPGGLAAAAGLLRAGQAVTIIDRAAQAGGKLLGVIPPSRLRPEDAEAEIRAVFGKVPADRLQWRLGCGMGVSPMRDMAVSAMRPKGVPPLGGMDVNKREGSYLPHWTKLGATYAVAFRLADALPQAVLENWSKEREEILRRAREQGRSLTSHEQKDLDKLYSARVESYLDAGAGACWLRQAPIARLVQDALKHFDGQRYDLIAWCVMPNHVHAIVRPAGDNGLASILHAWKSFTAKEANKVLGRQGQFWQEEYCDHLIRDEEDLNNQTTYILANPHKAGLESWPWCGVSRGQGQDGPATHGRDGHATHGQDAHATSFTLDNLFAEGFDAVVLAMGLGSGGSLAEDGAARPAGVMDAGAFLSHMNRNPDQSCPPRVAVLGGGNTAADAAVCAARHGAKDVYLVYRRSYQQMPAWPKERDEVLHAGVHLMLLCQPLGYVAAADGRLTGLRVQRTELGEPDSKGRRRPIAAQGGEFTLAIDLAVEALGDRMEELPSEALAGVHRSEAGLLVADERTQATSRPGVWAAGDCANGGTTVVQAVAEGLRAARAVNDYLAGGGDSAAAR